MTEGYFRHGAKPAIDKACGEGLLPGTLAALGKLGIGFQAGDGQIFRRIRFIDGSIFAEAEFMGEGGIGLRRTVLHQRMVERAKECGVELSWKSPVTAIPDGAIAGGKMVHAKWIVGADGLDSRGAGAVSRRACTARCGLRRGGTIAGCICVIAWSCIGVGEPRLT